MTLQVSLEKARAKSATPEYAGCSVFLCCNNVHEVLRRGKEPSYYLSDWYDGSVVARFVNGEEKEL